MDFKQIVNNLLSPENSSARLYETAKHYYFLSEITEISDDSENPADDDITFVKGGKAISPKDAARCILDYRRTAKFLQGIYSAIRHARKVFPGEKIEILYAGCGPFAALAIPQCVKFGSDEIAFTLIDIHQRSLDSAAKIFRKLGFENYVCEFIKTDAAVYRSENGKKFHIIITETMQKTLEKEPQVAITLNLAKQLREKGIFIPQKITIEACLAKLEEEFSSNSEARANNERVILGEIFKLSIDNFADSKSLFAPKILEFSSDICKPMSLILLTKIEIFDSIGLSDYDSGITYPTILSNLKNSKPDKKSNFNTFPKKILISNIVLFKSVYCSL